MQLGEIWQDEGFVFTGRAGWALNVNSLVNAFRALIIEVGLPAIRFHALRQTSATLLHVQGVHPKIVQER